MMSWFLECLEGKINIKSVMNHGGMNGIVRQMRMTKCRQSTMAEIKRSIENLLFMETVDQQLILLVSNQMVHIYRSISPALVIIIVVNYSFSTGHD